MSRHLPSWLRVALGLLLVVQVILPYHSVLPPPIALADSSAAPTLAAAPVPAALPAADLGLNLDLNLSLSLDLRLTAEPTQVEPGDVLTYTATIANAGDAALTALVLTDTLPAGLVYVAQSAVGFTYAPREQQLTWAVGTLAPGAVLTGSFQARVQGAALGSMVTNTVTATSATGPNAVQAVAPVEIVSPRSNEVAVTPTQGGHLRSTDGHIELRIPPGAVERPTRIVYTPRPDLAPVPAHILAPFALEAQDERGQAVRQFAAGLTLRLAYTPVQGSPAVYYEPGLFTLDETSGQWLAVASSVDQAAGRLQATLTHFSIYSEGNTSYVLERMSSLRGAQTNLFTRAIGYGYAFELPPGRGGLTPRLGLSYSSANHTPNSGHFSYPGFGWELTGADSVYTAPGDASTFQPTLSLQGATYSLRKTAAGTWFAKENPFLKITTAGGHHGTPATWYVWTPDGTKYTYSADTSTGAYYWKLCNTSDVNERYVRVPLVSIQDTASNTISFTWQSETETTVPYDCQIDASPLPTNQFIRALRLATISYNGGAVQVTLNYTTRDDRPDGYDNTAWRFYTTQRLTGVTVQAKENGSSTGALRTVRSYALGQSSGPATALSQKVLNLDWLEERSAGGSALPRTEFTYTNNYFTNDGQFGALSLVRNGYGGEVAFQSQNANSGAHVVNTRTERDGIDGTPDAMWSYTSSAWDATGDTLNPKLTQGYSQVTVTLPMGTAERHDFIVLSTVSNGQKVDHLAGRETQRVVLAGAVELAKTVTTWVSTTQSLPVTDTVSSEELRPRFVYAAASETYQDGQRQVRTENEYQTWRQGASGLQFGNLTEQRAYAGTPSGWEALPTRTRYFWYYPNTSAWLINKLAFTHLYKVCYGCTGAALVGASLYYYDYATSEMTAPSLGRLTKQRDGLDAEQLTTAEYDYWPNGNLRWVKDGKGNITETFYDSAFQAYPVCVKNALGQKTVTRYYGVPGSAEAGCTTTAGSLPWSGGTPVAGKVFGQVEDTTDANSAVTSLAYDAWGRVTQVWRPGEAITQSHSATMIFAYTNYSSPGAPFKVQQRQRDDALGGGNAATYLESYTFYDGLGQAIQTQAEAAASNQFSLAQTGYNGVGQVVSQTVPFTVTASLGTYQTSGWSQPATRTAYDALGRTVVVTNTDSSTVRTFYQARKTLTLDALNHQTVGETDAFGHLLNSYQYNGTFPTENWNATPYVTAAYGYNTRDQLTSVVVSDGVTAAITASSITYDTVGRKTAMTDADLGAWSYAYDAAGNLTRQTDARNQTICFYYDALNRLTGKHYRGDTSCPTSNPALAVGYTYDVGTNGKGRRTSMADNVGVTTWGYDARGRLLSESRVITGTGTFLTTWGYDTADRVTSLRYPANNSGGAGESVSYGYTSQGLLNSVVGAATYVQSTDYDAAGRVDLRKLGADVLRTDYVYFGWTTANGRGRLQQLKTGPPSQPSLLQDLSYTYDAVGNVKAIAEAPNGNQKQCFNYDPLDRLTQAFTGNDVCTAYDARGSGVYTATFGYADNERGRHGNLTQKGTSSLTYNAPAPASGCAAGTPTTKPHAAQTAGGNLYRYDCTGNVISRTVSGATTLFNYDAENRLARVTGNVTETHAYNGDGVRVRSVITTTGGVTTTIYIGAYFEWVSASITRTYYYAGNTRVAERVGSTVYYLFGDHLGSSSVSYRSDGGQTVRQWYGPWGGNRGTTGGALPTDYGFTGQRLDSGTTLLDYNARWYDPVLGRFYAADTLVPQPGNPQALNRYSYAANNPLRYTDPTGRYEVNEIEQYLRNQYGERWHDYLVAWQSDKLFWGMLRAAQNGDVLRAPSTQLTPGLFGYAEGSFTFNGDHQLYEYQGYGPYNLTNTQGNARAGYAAVSTITAHPVDVDSPRGDSWEQPVYRYTADGPKYSGYNRRVSYQKGPTRLDLRAGDSLPYLLGGGATEYLLAEVGFFAVCPECAAVIPVATFATAANNSFSTQYALTVSMADKRTFLQAANMCYPTPPDESVDLWK